MPRRDPWVYIGLFAFFALLFLGLFGERIAPHEAIYYVVEHGRDPRPYDPGVVFPFGSDALGRDLFSVVLAGARATLTIVLLGGAARVLTGLLIAAIGSWWRPARLVTDALGELLSAVPATIVALLIVKVFVSIDTSILIFIGALLVTGWAGPYRIFRVELDRLGHLQVTEAAAALGIGRAKVFIRHHLPHLVPLLAMNLSQQVVASLVLLAELGVLNTFVGATRFINVEESMTIVRTGPVNRALISEPVEWGGLLANARTIESLWTTRWLFLVPGVAFALTAVAIAAVGFATARYYARRNLLEDLRTRGAALLTATLVVMFMIAAVTPPRYAEAREWSDAAREAFKSGVEVEGAFASTGLVPVASTYAIERDTTQIVRTGPATAAIGDVSVSDSSGTKDLRALAYAGSGGGVVDAPVVFVGRGISPADYPPQRVSVFSAPDLGTVIERYGDDYAGVDVRGKIVLFARFMGVTLPNRFTTGPDIESQVVNATKRGAAAVVIVDPDLPRYVDVAASAFGAPVNPYKRLESAFPVTREIGVPVIALSVAAAQRLLAPAGVDIAPYVGSIEGADGNAQSRSIELRTRGRVAVPLQRASAHVRSLVAQVADAPMTAGAVLVWAVRHAGEPHPSSDVLAAVARRTSATQVPFVFVDFDPSVDPNVNARSVADALAGRRIALILVLDGLDGTALRFSSPFGDLIPAIDLYADRAGAAHRVTRTTADITTWSWTGIAPFPDTRTIVVNGDGGNGDLRPDAAAVVAYLAARYYLGAEELPR
ncbi:MAG TPA: ABC transporter permease subunit [Candidatus Limnocylindrales bacterium]|nr:ABC transporter permease subunit [Candidatus Limnocylindrales bacterium]